jgi:hypothetical protein
MEVECMGKVSGKKHHGRVFKIHKDGSYDVKFNNPKYPNECNVPRAKLALLHFPPDYVHPRVAVLDKFRTQAAPKPSDSTPSKSGVSASGLTPPGKQLPIMTMSDKNKSGSVGAARTESTSIASRSVMSSDSSAASSSDSPKRGATVASESKGDGEIESAMLRKALVEDAKYNHGPNKLGQTARLHSKSSRQMIVPGTSANAADNHPYMLPIGRGNAPLPPLQRLASLSEADPTPPSAPTFASMMSKTGNFVSRSGSRVAARNFITRKQSSIAAAQESDSSPYKDSVSSAGFRLSSKSFIMQKKLSSITGNATDETTDDDDFNDIFGEYYQGPQFDDNDRDSKKMKSATLIARQQNKLQRQHSVGSKAAMNGSMSTVLRGSASRRKLV